ncbi:MAG: hypothetical protein QG633_265 [Patescibacteria group bacterium]|jgi:hypothetical protein|nr:hypothetical protein [Patescibacteria group bacterium]
MLRKLIALGIILVGFCIAVVLVYPKLESIATYGDSSLRYYSGQSEDARVVLLFNNFDVGAVPIDASKVMVERYFDEYYEQDFYYIWTYAKLDSPSKSVAIYRLWAPSFKPLTKRTSTSSSFGPATCSLKKAIDVKSVQTIVKEGLDIDVEEKDILFGARVMGEKGAPYSKADFGDSVWSLSEDYLTSAFGNHFTEMSSEEKIQMIDWIKDMVVEEPGPHNIQNPSLVYFDEGLAGLFLIGTKAECFWIIRGGWRKMFIVDNDGEIAPLQNFPQFIIDYD